MSLSDSQLESEYQEHWWLIRRLGFNPDDSAIEELCKGLIEYYPSQIDLDVTYDNAFEIGYDEGYENGVKDTRKLIQGINQ